MGAKQLLSDIADLYAGKPILVICGGCTTWDILERMPADYPACVISANGHGAKQDKFKWDYMVHVDVMFGGTMKFQQYIAQFPQIKSISRWSFADYRIPEYGFSGDSGQTAVQVAAMMGGYPVVVAGLDRNHGPRRYWWQSTPERGWDTRRQPNVSQLHHSAKRLVEFLDANKTVLRCAKGMDQLWGWKVWTPDEVLPPFVPPIAESGKLRGRRYRTTRNLFLHPADPVGGGIVTLTENEALPHLRKGNIA